MWPGPEVHSGSSPTQKKKKSVREQTVGSTKHKTGGGGRSYHHKLAQLEYLGELVAHAERQRGGGVSGRPPSGDQHAPLGLCGSPSRV